MDERTDRLCPKGETILACLFGYGRLLFVVLVWKMGQ